MWKGGVLENHKVKLCITIVSTIDDRFKETCMKNFFTQLQSLGADEENIKNLIDKKVETWYTESIEQKDIIAVEIINGRAST
jgi:hypothetical protein